MFDLSLILFLSFLISATYGGDCEDPYPSLSDFHDYEPNLEFDDSDLQTQHPENDDGKKEKKKSLFNSIFRYPFQSIKKVQVAKSTLRVNEYVPGSKQLYFSFMSRNSSNGD